MALLFLEEDPWILEHESCEKLQRDIMGQLIKRQNFLRTSSNYAQISADIRLKLKQYSNEVQQLKQKLDLLSATSNSITAAESERRQRQIEVLLTKETQMKKMFDEQLSEKRKEERDQLLRAKSGTWDEDGAGSPNASVADIQSKQKQMLKDQEKGLENLSQIISRQKNIANTISDEVAYHNEILDGLNTEIDTTDRRMREGTQHISEVSRKDSTCGYWVVIIILFVSIIVVAAL